MERSIGDKMKKTDLKQLIKPLVKECIHEVLLEEGLLSNVVAEVAKGLQHTTLVENKQATAKPLAQEETQMKQQRTETQTKLKEYKNNLMKSIGEDAYNGVNLFEGTAPLQHSQPQEGHADIGATNDAGVDISSLVANSSAIWQALK
jgi:hypothetical protein